MGRSANTRNVGNVLADAKKDILVLRVDVMMLREPPLGRVDDVGNNQRRAYVIQDFGAIKT
jgi:hypothetical protein